MKILANTLLIICAAGVGLGVGFALRKRPVAVASEISTTASFPAGSSEKFSHSSKPRARFRPQDDSPLATQLERDLSVSTGVTRWLYWLAAIEQAAASDFPRLARLAEGNPTALQLVSDRWIKLYPRHLFDIIMGAAKNGSGLTKPMVELSRSLFTEWSRRDPQAVVAALDSVGDFGLRRQWQQRVATTIVEKDPEMGLRLMSEWHVDNYGPRMNGVAKWAAANPRHAAEFALANPAGYASQMVVETIGKEWAKTEPSRALEFAAGKPGDLGDRLASAALKEWAGRNLNEAANWLVGTDDRTRNRLSSAFVEVWAKQDAASALTWSESNLSGSSLVSAVGGVMKGVADKDVVAAAQLVAGLNPSAARTEAAVVVARKWFPGLSAEKPLKPEAMSWLGSLDPDTTRRVVDEIQWQWATTDPKSMAVFLATAKSGQMPEDAYKILARQLARTNPTEALEWAGQLPAERGISAGADAFAEWRASQPEAAMKWLNDLPATDARRQPFFENAIRSITYDSQAAERLAGLSPTERTAARSVIESMALPPDRRTRLLDALTAR